MAFEAPNVGAAKMGPCTRMSCAWCSYIVKYRSSCPPPRQVLRDTSARGRTCAESFFVLYWSYWEMRNVGIEQRGIGRAVRDGAECRRGVREVVCVPLAALQVYAERFHAPSLLLYACCPHSSLSHNPPHEHIPAATVCLLLRCLVDATRNCHEILTSE